MFTNSISNLFLFFLLFSLCTKCSGGSSDKFVDFEGEERALTEEERELHRQRYYRYRPGPYYHGYYSNECVDHRGIVYSGEPCFEVEIGGGGRNLRWGRRWWRRWFSSRIYRTQCTSYTCEDVDCDSDIGRLKCPQTCGWCTTVWDELEANFTEFASFLESANLSYYLQDIKRDRTVFAPDDTTFADFLAEERVANYSDIEVWGEHAKELAMYHIVRERLLSEDLEDGEEVTTVEGNTIVFSGDPPTTINDDAVITDPDIELRNGIVHGIDSVLLPPSAMMTTWEYLEASEDHTVLFDLLDNAETDFQTELDGGPHTVFAPTDDAFEGVDTTGLTGDEIDDILLYHVLVGNYMSYDLFWAGNVETKLVGEDLSFDARYFVLYINYEFGTPNPTGARVTEKNILTSTGVVHVIDSVLIPPDDGE